MKNKRPSKDQYYLNIAKEIARRCTCYRTNIGAIIVRDDQIIATGYVGAPRKTKDCFEHGFCLRTRLKIPHGHRYELCRSIHSEMNAIINAARAGVSLLGGNMYIYGELMPKGRIMDATPCFICKKMIINAGLNQVIVSTAKGKTKRHKVSDWIKDWRKKDILDDKHQYGDGVKVYSEKALKEK